ncbi:hypothetical protein BJP36_37195 [Moorena producens JHB]|uniref:Uncharacterized protein n=1 Tax=Moorena producens (strain JHB) TaxID=1454205 RepID=A0A9Q9SU70_MOOP1|nr:hypothetical protein [Moorena producens]WAN69730.1 hypothetical protein BJP36_37195 [Moorena producens JHB]
MLAKGFKKNYGRLNQLRQGWGGSSLGDVVKGVDPPKSPLIRGTLPIPPCSLFPVPCSLFPVPDF